MNSVVRTLIVAIALWFVSATAFANPGYQNFSVCHGFGCKFDSRISLSRSEWRSVADWFQPGVADATGERKQIRQAIGWMEHLVGRHGPGRQDRGLDLQNIGRASGQMDCVDESLNTTTYLKLFEDSGLLHWHRVAERIQRQPPADAHWAGQIEEIVTAGRYVVDSWFYDNGMLPIVQRIDEWLDIPGSAARMFPGLEPIPATPAPSRNE